MTCYRFPENKYTKAAFGLFFFAVLYLARDTLVTSSLLGFYQSQFLMLGLFLLLGLVFLWVNRKRWKEILRDKRMGVLGAAALIVLVPMALKRDWQMMYFSILICIFCAVFLTFFVNSKEAAKYYVVILTVLAAYSVLAAYLLRRLPDQGILSVPVFYNQDHVDFYNFILSFVSVGYLNTRNFGIFREPGVYQFFLILALYLTHYKVEWKRPLWMWVATGILSVTMITTLATGGIAELGLLALVVFFDKKLYRKKAVLALVLVLLVLLAVILVIAIDEKNAVYWVLYDNLIAKFVNRTDSVTERAEALRVNLELYVSSPIVGVKIAQVLHAVEHNTISTPILFTIFGLLGGLLHIASWVALVWERNRKLWVNLALLGILAISFNTQNLIADVFFWLFPVMALTERVLPAIKMPERRKNG